MHGLKCLVVVILLTASLAQAKEIPLCQGDGILSLRCLGGHLFVPSRFMIAPFMTTDFGTHIQGSLGTTLQAAPPDTYKKHGLASAGINYQLQVALIDWLAVFGSILVGGSSGIGGSDAIFASVGATIDYDLGVRFKLLQTSKFLMSANAKMVGSVFKGIKPIKFALSPPSADDINTCSNPGDNDESKKLAAAACARIAGIAESHNYDLGAQLDLSMAWGVTPVFGIWGTATYSHFFRSPRNALNFKGQVLGGIAVSVDLAPVTPVPIGIIAGAQFAYLFEFVNRPTHQIGSLNLLAGLMYTGSPWFSAGFELTNTITPFLIGSADERANLITASLNFRYYWN